MVLERSRVTFFFLLRFCADHPVTPPSTMPLLTRDQRQVLASLVRGGNCWVCQPEMASLAALGLAERIDTCAKTGAGKYVATDAGRAWIKERAA
jgi:hypothetical protein